MGNKNSLQNITEEMIEDYCNLSYLSRYEIMKLFKTFRSLGPDEVDANFDHRFHIGKITEIMPQIEFNPFKQRLVRVFSSRKDDHFSFEDVLDLCSVMSDNCPDKVKAKWAFKIYDFNEDGNIDKEDIANVVNALTKSSKLEDNEIERIADEVLKAINIQNTGGITELEFEHAIAKMADFAHSFRFQF